MNVYIIFVRVVNFIMSLFFSVNPVRKTPRKHAQKYKADHVQLFEAPVNVTSRNDIISFPYTDHHIVNML